MKKLILSLALFCSAISYGQKELPDAEEKDLRRALAEAGSSSVEFVRALEQHLVKYPNSPQKEELENAIVKSAMEAKDNERTLQYGERVLARKMDNPQILERVARLLLNNEDKESNQRALKYSQRLEELLRGVERDNPTSGHNRAQLQDEIQRVLSRAIAYQARATGNLGKIEEAVQLANKSYDTVPNAESAREIGRWLAKAGKDMEAISHYADAFTIDDPKVTDAERAKDRMRMGELYRKLKGNETGLGDLILQAYDRTSALMGLRLSRQRERDPNSDLTDPMQFTLTGLKGDKLQLSSLKGKVVVMDFWATWCGPCRAQQPLYEQVKKHFAGRDEVVFLAIDTDEDQSVVAPFLENTKWSKRVYFEDGLASLLKVSSIPSTLIFDPNGKLFSRMNGFLPDRFVAMLTDRINEALAEKSRSSKQ